MKENVRERGKKDTNNEAKLFMFLERFAFYLKQIY